MASTVDTSLFALNLATASARPRRRLRTVDGLPLSERSRRGRDGARRTGADARPRDGPPSSPASRSPAAMAALMLMPQRFLYSIGAAGAAVGVLSAVMACSSYRRCWPCSGRASTSGRSAAARRSPRRPVVVRLAQGVMRRPISWPCRLGVLHRARLAVARHHLDRSERPGDPAGQQSYETNEYLAANYGRERHRGRLSRGAGSRASELAVDDPGRLRRAFGRAVRSRRRGRAFTTAALEDFALAEASQDAVHQIRASPPRARTSAGLRQHRTLRRREGEPGREAPR